MMEKGGAAMHYVFFYSDGKLFSGYSVFSDYAPHTAMIRSFSLRWKPIWSSSVKLP